MVIQFYCGVATDALPSRCDFGSGVVGKLLIYLANGLLRRLHQQNAVDAFSNFLCFLYFVAALASSAGYLRFRLVCVRPARSNT